MNTTKPRASHVNTGTSIPRAELAQPTTDGPSRQRQGPSALCSIRRKVEFNRIIIVGLGLVIVGLGLVLRTGGINNVTRGLLVDALA